MPPTQEDDEQS